MKDSPRLDGLLVCREPQILSVMNRILGEFSIASEVCSDSGSAIEAVTHRRWDALLVDWNVAYNSIGIVSAARLSSPNRNSTIVAMVMGSSEMQAALLAGANFIIHKPASHFHVTRCIRAAYGTMLQQRRRTARFSVEIPVVAEVAELGRLEGTIVDISIGGVALQFQHALQIGWTVSLTFVLPGSEDLIHITGQVVNADGKGRAGISLSLVPEKEFSLLVSWLSTELAKLDDTETPVTATLETSL